MAEQAFSGQNRIVVDWDGTCVASHWPEQPIVWLPGAVDALKDFASVGYEVVIFSTRLAPFQVDELSPVTAFDWLREYNYIRNMLDREMLTYVKIWTHPWKPGALFYIDDKAVSFKGNWSAVVKEVLP